MKRVLILITFLVLPIFARDTLTAVADFDYEPYSFYDENGKISGFDVDVLNAIAKQMDVHIDIKLVIWSEAKRAITSGKAQVIAGLPAQDKKHFDFEYSIATDTDKFVCFSKKDILYISELYGKKLATLSGGAAITEFINPYNLEQSSTFYDTYTEAIKSVIEGKNDCAIARYRVGKRAIASLNSDVKLKASKLSVAVTSDAFGFQKGDSLLRDKFNNAILELAKTGELDRISQKWLEGYVDLVSVSDFLIMYKMELIVLAGILIALISSFLIFQYYIKVKGLEKDKLLLQQKADVDPLTGVYNKKSTENMVQKAIECPDSQAILIIDIDLFKNINDRAGHAFGDEVIQNFAATLLENSRKIDVVGRIGGDEFLLLLRDIPNREWLEKKLCSLNHVLYKEVESPGGIVNVSASIGAYIKNNSDTFMECYKNADKALYKSKAKGRNCWTIIGAD